MPWHVAKTSECPRAKPWGVINETTGKVQAGGCHTVKSDAEKHMRALYANVPEAQQRDGQK